uniref:Uncharacterized protein n=1 Tax=viral metagenome TaxID=1070528 RepID=A0A6H2A387_9ZZZZ
MRYHNIYRIKIEKITSCTLDMQYFTSAYKISELNIRDNATTVVCPSVYGTKTKQFLLKAVTDRINFVNNCLIEIENRKY